MVSLQPQLQQCLSDISVNSIRFPCVEDPVVANKEEAEALKYQLEKVSRQEVAEQGPLVLPATRADV